MSFGSKEKKLRHAVSAGWKGENIEAAIGLADASRLTATVSAQVSEKTEVAVSLLKQNKKLLCLQHLNLLLENITPFLFKVEVLFYVLVLGIFL